MQRHPTFMDQKTSCCWEGKTLPSGSTNSMPSYQHLRCLLIFTETDKMILKFMRKCKEPSIVKAIFKQKDKVRELCAWENFSWTQKFHLIIQSMTRLFSPEFLPLIAQCENLYSPSIFTVWVIQWVLNDNLENIQ